jgi:hypothetical protein
MTENEDSIRENIKPRSCCIDRAIARYFPVQVEISNLFLLYGIVGFQKRMKNIYSHVRAIIIVFQLYKCISSFPRSVCKTILQHFF